MTNPNNNNSMKSKKNPRALILTSIALGITLPSQAQLTWNPLPNPDNIWDLTTLNWASQSAPPNTLWDNSGSQTAIFEDVASTVLVADGGVTVGDLTLSPGTEVVTLTSVTDNLGLITIAPGGATWNLGGRELEFANNNSDTPLAISPNDTLTISGGGIFDTGERPIDANWTANQASLVITDPTIVRGNTNSVGAFSVVSIASGSTYIHERNTNQAYSTNWVINGTDNLTITNRFSRTINLADSIIDGTGGLTISDLASTDVGGNNLLLSNENNSFQGGIIVDATNQATLLIVSNGDSVLGAVPAAFDPDNITLRNSGRIRLTNNGNPMNLNPNRGITLDNGGTIILSGNDNTVNAPITGVGPLQIGLSADNNANVLHLDAQGSNYTGGTNIVRGTISPGTTNGLPADTILTLGGTAGNAHFDLNGLDQTIGGLTVTGSNTRTLRNLGANPATLTIDVAAGESFTYTSNIDESGIINITKEGPGTQAILRTAGFTTDPGDIAVNAGTLELGVNDSLGDVTIGSGATLIAGQTGTLAPASVTAVSGAITTYNWSVNDWTGTPGAGWSSLDVIGDFTSPSGSTLAITINEANLVNFTETNQTFVIATIGGNLDVANANLSLDTSGFTSGTGTWAPVINGNTLELVYTTGTGATAYDTFVAGFPSLIGGFNDDDDNDGFTNGEEFYFGGSDPTSAGSTVTGLNQVTSNTTGAFSFTHLRPIDTTGITADYEWSSNLAQFFDNGASDGTFTVTISAGTPSPDIAGFESVTVTATSAPATAAKLFARIRLTLN